MVTFKLFKNVSRKAAISEVENAIAMFLPVYILWTIVVTFIFLLLFYFESYEDYRNNLTSDG